VSAPALSSGLFRLQPQLDQPPDRLVPLFLNETGIAVLRPCCVERFVEIGKRLIFLVTARSHLQHGIGSRTKPETEKNL
jgi:hypothetical protein